ncbi:MAG: ABC transporter substrate-binding protein, partial [Bacteroidetes bacterium]|nr:ABC transporter substrate-binding protein [Bacteroidota bacterium]
MSRSALCLVLPLLLVAGCMREQAPQGSGIHMTDGLGRTVFLENLPSRVVSIAPGATEIVLAAGAADRLVGVSTADGDVPVRSDLPRFSALPLDTEAVVALQPDLVLASEQVNDPAHADLFDALDIPILYLESSTWDGVLQSIEQVGDLLGTSDAARKTVDSLTVRQKSLLERTSGLEKRPTAIFLVSQETSWSFGRGSFVIDLMEWA